MSSNQNLSNISANLVLPIQIGQLLKSGYFRAIAPTTNKRVVKHWLRREVMWLVFGWSYSSNSMGKSPNEVGLYCLSTTDSVHLELWLRKQQFRTRFYIVHSCSILVISTCSNLVSRWIYSNYRTGWRMVRSKSDTIQSNLNGSNISGTMEIRSRHE